MNGIDHRPIPELVGGLAEIIEDFAAEQLDLAGGAHCHEQAGKTFDPRAFRAHDLSSFGR
jgi:hypothetical protein